MLHITWCLLREYCTAPCVLYRDTRCEYMQFTVFDCWLFFFLKINNVNNVDSYQEVLCSQANIKVGSHRRSDQLDQARSSDRETGLTRSATIFGVIYLTRRRSGSLPNNFDSGSIIQTLEKRSGIHRIAIELIGKGSCRDRVWSEYKCTIFSRSIWSLLDEYPISSRVLWLLDPYSNFFDMSKIVG